MEGINFGYGFGDGSGFDDGSGSGFSYGYGDGYGYSGGGGDGGGNGFGSGDGCGSGDGYGFDDGHGFEDGYSSEKSGGMRNIITHLLLKLVERTSSWLKIWACLTNYSKSKLFLIIFEPQIKGNWFNPSSYCKIVYL